MHILAIIPYTPTPIRTRSYNLLLSLAERGHRVTLATLWENSDEKNALEIFWNHGIEVIDAELPKSKRAINLVTGLLSNKPIQAKFSLQPKLFEKINQWSRKEKPDLVHVEHLRGAEYGLWAQKAMKPVVPVVWDAVDCISLLFERASKSSRKAISRLVTRIELPRTRKYEGLLTNQFHKILVTSPMDRDAFGKLAINAHSHYTNCDSIKILPNGVSLKEFTPKIGEQAPVGVPTITMTGKMSYHANATAAHWLIEKVMPLVWMERPEAIVQFVGSDPNGGLQRLVNKHPKNIIATGYVPEIASYLQNCTVAVAPIVYGVGIQNKVLEAMACGAPVVATSQAVSAIHARSGVDCLVADDEADFARNILLLIADENRRINTGLSGRRYVELNHSWDAIVEQYEQIVM